jgi:hypothetical protein
MDRIASCEVCGGANRSIWHCLEDFAPLSQLLLGNKVALLVCPACRSLWCYAHLGGPPVQPVAVRWNYGAEDWQKTYDLDDGESLRKWFQRQVKNVSREVEHPCGRKVCRFRARPRKQTST